MFYITIYNKDGSILEEIETDDLSEIFSPFLLRSLPHLSTGEVFEDEGWEWGEVENVTIRVEKKE